jgi:hypothetical protein
MDPFAKLHLASLPWPVLVITATGNTLTIAVSEDVQLPFEAVTV